WCRPLLDTGSNEFCPSMTHVHLLSFSLPAPHMDWGSGPPFDRRRGPGPRRHLAPEPRRRYPSEGGELLGPDLERDGLESLGALVSVTAAGPVLIGLADVLAGVAGRPSRGAFALDALAALVPGLWHSDVAVTPRRLHHRPGDEPVDEEVHVVVDPVLVELWHPDVGGHRGH